ncbi:unnamed protein product [Effrenium voratum]|nr:unnamed protein product [Effrenium voratum]
MCLDGVARTGDWEKAKRENPDDLNWLTEWVVAARTGQLKLLSPQRSSKGIDNPKELTTGLLNMPLFVGNLRVAQLHNLVDTF